MKLPDRSRLSPGLWLRKNWITILVLVVAAGIFVLGYAYAHDDSRPIYQYQSAAYDNLSYQTATVLNISSDTVEIDRSSLDGREVGTQVALIRLTSGPLKGQTCELEFSVSTFSNRKLSVGDKIVVYQYLNDDGELQNVYMYEHDRTIVIFGMIGAFFLITILVGGKTGAKSLLGLIITVICIIWIFCPLLMKGKPVVPTAFLICAYVAIVSFIILGGVNKKTLCAIVGTLAGMGLAALFGVIAQSLAKIDSYSMYSINNELDEFRNIQISGIPLHINGMLTGGIIIASLGAVMDVAMSLSSSISELKSVNSQLTTRQLWRSGMNIGHDMVGTMTNTLILAFVGSSLVLIIYLWSLGLSFNQLVSSSFLSVEVISSLSSSIGVVLAVPLTALVASLAYGHTPKEKRTDNKTGKAEKAKISKPGKK